VVDGQLDAAEVGIAYQDGMVTTLSYALSTKWGQMAYLRDSELQLFRQIVWNNKLAHQWFLYETLNHVMAKGGKFHVHHPQQAKIVEVDRYTDLTKAKKI